MFIKQLQFSYLLLRSMIGILCIVPMANCNQLPNVNPLSTLNPKPTFFNYLKKGDSVYASKSNYEAFGTSIKYFDSASVLAEKAGDSALLAEAVFAKARVYDAWNKDPQKTIALFAEAARQFGRIGTMQKRYLYATHLTAHAYDKIKDSVHCVQILNTLYQYLIAQSDSFKKQIIFIPEMALVATEVGNYNLAEKILNNLTKESLIRNDPNTYNYRDHYILTRARITIFYNQNNQLPLLDSLVYIYQHATNPFDSSYYSLQLAMLYAKQGQYQKAYIFATENNTTSLKINNQQGISNLQNRLLQQEIEAQTRKATYEQILQRNRHIALWILAGLLIAITVLSLRLFVRNKTNFAMASTLQKTNSQLKEIVIQNEILNKEIHHRVKNNLYMVTSLLRMQERNTDNEETINNLQKARVRIDSIAALHEQLLKLETAVDFNAYIAKILNTAVECIGNGRHVITHLNMDPIHLPASSSFAIALILNEWITNSLKYANTASNMLEVTLSAKYKNNKLVLQYIDNGATHKNTQNNLAPSLGTEIVNLLCKQLKATLTNIEHNAYQYVLTVPYGE